MNKAFAKGTPSVFVVCSPFQVLAAIEAIYEFEITKYKIFVQYYATEAKRFDQLVHLLNDFKLDYNIIDFTTKSKLSLLKVLLPKNNEYKRAFIGHYRLDYMYYTAFENISNDSEIVYLDDGTNCLELLEGNFDYCFRINRLLIQITSFLRRIPYRAMLNLFTIYTNYPIKIKNVNIHPNQFNFLSSCISSKKDKIRGGVFFVGTAHKDYYLDNHLPEDLYLKSLREILIGLKCKYEKENIYYLPHGRDNSLIVKSLCERLGISYIRPDSIVEIFLISNYSSPSAIFGFTSSALFNLRKLYPSTYIGNYLCKEHHSKLYGRISNYYQNNKIDTIYY